MWIVRLKSIFSNVFLSWHEKRCLCSGVSYKNLRNYCYFYTVLQSVSFLSTAQNIVQHLTLSFNKTSSNLFILISINAFAFRVWRIPWPWRFEGICLDQSKILKVVLFQHQNKFNEIGFDIFTDLLLNHSTTSRIYLLNSRLYFIHTGNLYKSI